MFCCPSFAMLMYSCGRHTRKIPDPSGCKREKRASKETNSPLGLLEHLGTMRSRPGLGSAEGRELGLEAQQLQEVVLVTYISFPRLGV